MCSILRFKGRTLGERCKKLYRPLLAVVFLVSAAPFALTTGQTENRLRDATALIAQSHSGSEGLGLSFETVRETISDLSEAEILLLRLDFAPVQLLELAGILIDQEQYNKAAVLLTGLVFENDEQQYVAEDYFAIIRNANEQYVMKGEEVNAKLQELLSEEITDEELIPTATQILALISEMETVVPHPNPRDAVIVENLRYSVQLTVDRRRFSSLMDAAAERLAAEDYAGAVEIYISGITDAGAAGSAAGTEVGITLENGVDIQRRFFEERDYGLLGDQVANTRESLRTLGLDFVQVGPEALQRADELSSAFLAGDFSDAQSKVAEYLSILQTVTGYLDEMESAGEVLTGAEEFTSRQAVEDENNRVDWHVLFLHDIVLGRETAESPEGILYAVNTVREIVERGPVEAAQQFGLATYDEGVAVLDSISWPRTASTFTGYDLLEQEYERGATLLSQAGISLDTFAEVLSVSRNLGLVTPDSPNSPGSFGDDTVTQAWETYLSDVFGALEQTNALEDESIRTNLLESTSIAAAANYLRLIVSRALEMLDVADARRTTIAALNTQREGVREILGTLSVAESGTLRELLQSWRGFTNEAITNDDERASRAFAFNSDYLESRIGDAEGYERLIVESIARLEYNGLNSRLSSLQSRTEDAQGLYDGVAETVTFRDESGAILRDDSNNPVVITTVRRYPDRARDILVPMVGQTSGTRILNTSLGDMQNMLDDARDYVERYSDELPYIVTSEQLQSDISRGNQLANTIGEVNGNGLFRRARDLLQDAISAIADARDLEAQGNARVATIRDLIDRAIAASAAEDLDLAGETLAQAESLLKSDDRTVRDASDLFADSLATWYRSDLEDRWNATQKTLNDDIALAQANIVFTRVQQDVEEAQPLVDSQRWNDALVILQAADDLWSNVFPQTVYQPLYRLLRYVEVALAKQNDRFLSEDDPDFDKLAPLLSRATQALTEGLINDASALLDQFLRAQPNNLEARLLEVDIALASVGGDIESKINRLISNSLPEGTTRSQISSLESTDAFELQSLLIAIEDRIRDRSDVSNAVKTQIQNEITELENKLSPPPVVVVTADIRAETNALIDQALANGSLQSLSAAQLEQAVGFLEQALDKDPTNQRAIELLGTALRLPNGPRRQALDATEQQVLSRARDFFARGQNIEALQLINQLWADPSNWNDTELTRFRQELLDAIRRQQ